MPPNQETNQELKKNGPQEIYHERQITLVKDGPRTMAVDQTQRLRGCTEADQKSLGKTSQKRKLIEHLMFMKERPDNH